MNHWGERLRQQRVANGMDLSRIAEDTRISVRYLQAIEDGEWHVLPGAIFARSFARQYARYVGLDEASIEAEVQATFQNEPQLPQLDPAPRGSIPLPKLREVLERLMPSWDRMPKPFLSLATALVVCSGVYVGWQKLVLGPPEGQQIAADPARNMPPTKLSTGQDSSSTPVSVETASQASGTGTTEIALAVPAGTTGGISVRIVAQQETWVSITANGKRLFAGTLRPNEARQLSGVESAKMVIGNAGGVEVIKDGQSIGPIGPPGQVRVVLITPQGPQIYRQSKAGASRT